MSKASEEISENASNLLELARKRFGKLNKAAEKLFRSFADGEVADYSAKKEEDNDPAKADKWSLERVLDADRISWLCIDRGALELATHNGIRVRGARIEGELDLSNARISFLVSFEKSAFPDGINLRYAEIRNLNFSGTHTGPIYGDGLRVEGDVYLREDFKSNGVVDLTGATIGSSFDCRGGKFIKTGAQTLSANSANVKGNVFLNGDFRAEGWVNLDAATIGGGLDCNGGQFINKEAQALSANSANVKGNVFLNGDFKAEGWVNLDAAKIDGGLACNGGQFINKEAQALSFNSANIKDSVFLRGGFKSEGEVNLVGATIGGGLDCEKGQFINKGETAISADGVKIVGDIYLRNGFKSEGKVRLYGATIGGSLDCRSGQFINKDSEALIADGLNVNGSIFLNEGFKSEGQVRLYGGVIRVNLDCINGWFINQNAEALIAKKLDVSGSVLLCDDFKAEGEVNLAGATINGNLDCHSGHFMNKCATAINADGVKVKGNVFLHDGFKAEGEVNIAVAKIDGNLECGGGQFINPNGIALMANSLHVKNSTFFKQFMVEGEFSLVDAEINGFFYWMDLASTENLRLDLRSAKIGTLRDEEKSWPEKWELLLHGLVYNEIHNTAPRGADSRIDWLRRQKGFWPQPYEQLAEVLGKGGQDEEARKVLIAKNEEKAGLTTLTRSEKIWYRVLGPMIGYGYRPLNALWGVLLFVVLGWILFGTGYLGGLISPENDSAFVKGDNGITIPGDERKLSEVYPRFNFLIYSIDTFVPLIDLHQSKYWLPNANRGYKLLNIKGISLHIGGLLRLYLWIHIAMGWALSTLLVVGLTGLVRT